MNNFKIYVKTSALGKTGIHWRSIESEEHQPVEVPSLIKRQVIEENGKIVIVNDLIDEVKPSLIIFRDKEENKLLLEVTGIESPQRSIQLGRTVLNSIVWIADNLEENEEVLRKIAYSAIQNILHQNSSFSKMIEESIDFFELEEFRVSLQKVHQFIQKIEQINTQYSNDIESYELYQIENKSTDNLKKLAEEILNNPLPKKWTSWDGEKNDGVLVVVTENLEKRTILHKAGVWRGFASRVEEPVREVKSQEKKTNAIPFMDSPEVEETQVPSQPNQKIRLMIMLLITAITIVLIVVSLKLLFQPQPQQTSQPQTIQQQTSELQAKQILEPQPQSTQTPQIQS
ncbi:hypothetical protein [Iningainema tapete]|uniref:Uncharacterized protein n=1 Tax=Iningainema tapete BLCC-T55 TaxID=2748662 RepID=A0A8J6XKZ9_9CYAN|nr:hypothetical protein [Iningainema tapete]MBD2773539.1 hypothetical protein [Iningainema tapete BLCC-T55]